MTNPEQDWYYVVYVKGIDYRHRVEELGIQQSPNLSGVKDAIRELLHQHVLETNIRVFKGAPLWFTTDREIRIKFQEEVSGHDNA